MDQDPVSAAISPTPVAIRAARGLLTPLPPTEPLWPLVGAAALFAVSALSFAIAVIAGPPHFGAEPPQPTRSGVTEPL